MLTMINQVSLISLVSSYRLRSDIGYQIDTNGSKVYVDIGPDETKRLIPNNFVPKIDFSINNISIKNLAGSLSGGGMFLNNVGWDIPSLVLNNSTFSNCSSSQMGGAIYNKDILYLTINNSSFHNNWATSGGGAIYIQNCVNAKIMNSQLTNNNSTSNEGSTCYIQNSTIVDFDNLTIDRSTSRYGALYLIQIGTFLMNNTRISNCIGYDGEILYLQNTKNFSITKCLFENSSSTSSYGSMYISSINQGGIIENCVFSILSGPNGGAIFLTSIPDVQINRCLFFLCTVSGSGGAIYSSGTTRFSIRQCCFHLCRASSNYHSIYVAPLNSLSITNSNFSSFVGCGTINQGSENFYISSGTSDVTMNNFSNNHAASRSCICINSYGLSFLQYSTIFNHSTSSNPVFQLTAYNHPIVVQYNNMIRNTATSSFIFQFSVSSTSSHVFNCIFSLNSGSYLFSCTGGSTLVGNCYLNHSSPLFTGTISFQNTIMGATETYHHKHLSTYGCEANIDYQELNEPCQTQPNPPTSCIYQSEVQSSTLSQFTSILQLVLVSFISYE